MFAAYVLYQHSGICLFENGDNLALAKLRFFHVNLLAIKCQKALLMSCLRYGEAYDLSPKSTAFVAAPVFSAVRIDFESSVYRNDLLAVTTLQAMTAKQNMGQNACSF